MCKSKCRSIVFKCPPKLRVMLFKAYVIPHFTYASEVLPYTHKHVQSMNKLIVEFARWATGLPSYADSDAVLREAGLRPIQYDMLQARLNYWLLLKSRDPTHATNLALADISHRASTSSLYKWYKHIRDVFVKLNCDSLLASPSASINKCVIKRVVHECSVLASNS